MARIRTIKPDFWKNEELSALHPECVLLAIGLLNHADDEGFFKAHPKLIESEIFPLRELSQTILGMLQELSKIGYIQLFHGDDGKAYGKVSKFKEHQRVDKPKASKIKDLVNIQEQSETILGTLYEGKEGKGKEQGKETERKEGAKRFCPPSLEEVSTYCYERQNQVIPQRFIDHYESNGWMVGKNKMKDWKAAIRNWESRGNSNGQNQQSSGQRKLSVTERATEARKQWERENPDT